MGIATGTFQQLLQEHRARPFQGRLLTLGVQDTFLTKEDVRFWADYYGVPCCEVTNPELSPKSALAARGFISARTLFAYLGIEVESLDASAYEACDYIADLNTPAPPDEIADRFDLVLDTGTFEHVFHLPNAFQFCHTVLKKGGRMIHMSPLSNYADHGFYMVCPTLFFDFYEANGWQLLQARVIRHTQNHESDPYWSTDYSPEHFASQSFGGLGDGLYQTFVVARKQQRSTAHIAPQQRAYRLHTWTGSTTPAAEGAFTNETIAERIRTRLCHYSAWIKGVDQNRGTAIYGAGSHTRILLESWNELGLPSPRCVFQTTYPGTETFGGCRLVSLADLANEPPPALIVLSSHRHEGELAARCASSFPGIPLIRCWT